MKKRKIWSKEEEQFLRDNLATMSYDELAEHFQVEKVKVVDKANKMGLNRKLLSGELWSKEEDELLAKHFEWAPRNKLLKMFPNRTWSAIYQRGYLTLKLPRLSQDKYDIDYNFFSEWTEQSAYIYGFILADGYLKYEHGDRNENSIQFELAGYDRDILDKIKNALQYEGPVTMSGRDTAKLSFSNKKICMDLIEKGMPVKNKTANGSWPVGIPKELERHFIRGIFDGDGSVYPKANTVCFRFLGTLDIIQHIKELLPLDLSNVSILDRSKSTHPSNVHSLQIERKDAAPVVFEYLYKDATIYLDRKYNRAKELLKAKNNIVY